MSFPSPAQVELYLSLGTLLEATDKVAALQLYLQVPTLYSPSECCIISLHPPLSDCRENLPSTYCPNVVCSCQPLTLTQV